MTVENPWEYNVGNDFFTLGDRKLGVCLHAQEEGGHIRLTHTFIDSSRDTPLEWEVNSEIPIKAGKEEAARRRITSDWDRLCDELDEVKEAARSYLAFKKRGQDDPEALAILLSVFLGEHAAHLAKDGHASDFERRQAFRIAAGGRLSQSRGFGPDEIEQGILQAGQLLQRMEGVIAHAMETTEYDAGHDFEGQQMTPVMGAFDAFRTHLRQTLEAMDETWAGVAGHMRQSKPMAQTQLAKMMVEIGDEEERARESFALCLQELKDIGRDEDIAALSQFAYLANKDNPGLFTVTKGILRNMSSLPVLQREMDRPRAREVSRGG